MCVMQIPRAILTCWAALALVALGPADESTAASATWSWPVEGPVIRGFDPPDSPYGSGHRGDIASPAGSVAVAPADGTVAFAGPVGERLFLTIDHGGGVESTFSWVACSRSAAATWCGRGSRWLARAAATGDLIPNLHFGVRLDDAYVDPLAYLAPMDVSALIRLAPLVA